MWFGARKRKNDVRHAITYLKHPPGFPSPSGDWAASDETHINSGPNCSPG